MNIRSFHPNDINRIKEIHEKHFKDEFNLPDFMNYVSAMVVEDEKGIILAGGIRTIAECVAVTDLSRDTLDRAEALKQLLQFSVFTCGQTNYDQMYVWSRNPNYTKRLKKCGFRESDAQSLILDL